MSGFKNFVLRGNLVDVAVAFIIGAAFASVVTTFVAWLTAQLPAAASRVFSNDPNSLGAFLNALIAFLLLRMAHALQNNVQSLLTFTRLVADNLMQRRSINTLLDPPPPPIKDQRQLNLNLCKT